ncbi:hypothetical protein L7F22_066051 [Adiantum nelumboides]|nr:hypothetical protein [Adiantum nelumboides]
MASTSDPPAGGGGETTSVAVAPASEPPPSSKRRWSPCTWRYAIEEVQPELGSRARTSSSNPSHSSSSLRNAGPDHHAPPQATSKSRPLHSHDHAYGKDGDEPVVRRSTYGDRTWGGTIELSELRARHAQGRAQDMLSKKRPPHPHRSLQQHQQKVEHAKRPKEEQEDEDEDEEWDDDAELGHHFEETKKRKTREMSPSELYYCEICRAKAAEASKQNVSPDSPLPLQDF